MPDSAFLPLSRRRTVGLVLAGIHTGSSRDLWQGALEAAESYDLNLLVFPCGRLDVPDAVERMRNRLFDIPDASLVDGLVTWASSLGGHTGLDRLEARHARFDGLPLVSLAQKIGNSPVVSIDVYSGMYELISHLIELHGFTRIAFVRGPENHLSAAERFRAYRDCLDRHGLQYDTQLVSSPFRWDEGARAAEEFLDARKSVPGSDFQAVAASSDLQAFSFLRTLQSRGYQVPGDVVVTGFNNSRESLLSVPPLTTVATPFRQLGERGIASIAGILSGNKADDEHLLPARLLVRQSCGCASREVELAGSANPSGERESDAEELRERIIRDAGDLAGLDEATRNAWLLPLCDAFESEFSSQAGGQFLILLERILGRVTHRA